MMCLINCFSLFFFHIFVLCSKVVVQELVVYVPSSSSHYSTFEIDVYEGPYYLNTTFAKLMLQEHNKKRSVHGAQKLRWSIEVFNYAAQFAQEYNCSGTLQHSGGKYGENLAYGYTPIGAINAWYEEGDNYPYGSESIYNHFTALIWNDTNSIGCAYKSCPNGALYITCNYNPPGNVIGYCSKNVFPPI